MDPNTPVIRTRGLKKHYNKSSGLFVGLLGEEEVIRAVDGVDIDIYPNEVLGVVGESGSGKSTLGETILRLEEPTSGKIYFKGQDITEFSSERVREFRQDAQIIFQDPYGSLNPKKTIRQIVAEPLKNFDVESDFEAMTDRRDRGISSYRDRPTDGTETVEAYEVDGGVVLHDVGLRPPDEFLAIYPDQLSGGQRQRVAIARALVLEPDLLIADEPMSMLDVSIQSQIIQILTDLQDKLQYALMYISHDLSVVSLLADRIAVMYRGKVVETGDADALTRDSKHPYTRALIRSLPDLTTRRERVLFDTFTEEASEVDGCSFHPRCPERMEMCQRAVPGLQAAEEREVRCYLYHDTAEDGSTVETSGK